MKVCLVGAPTAHEFDDRTMGEAEALRTIAEHAPLGVLSLAAVLEDLSLRDVVQADVDCAAIGIRVAHELGARSGERENGAVAVVGCVVDVVVVVAVAPAGGVAPAAVGDRRVGVVDPCSGLRCADVDRDACRRLRRGSVLVGLCGGQRVLAG